ncbi:MAG: hypothetical protein JSS49_22875 [Planctomycetes bacterium]|nr:hypothetical protein [Planctomycetota bacterium]
MTAEVERPEPSPNSGTRRTPPSWIRSLCRRLVVCLLVTVVAGIVIEGLSLVILLIQHGSLQQHRLFRECAARQICDTRPDPGLAESTILHPYLGSIPRPDGPDKSGYMESAIPLCRRSNDRLIVGITGGAAARRISVQATDVLSREISTFPEFAGRTCHFVRLAADGFKQPQQLMILNYLLSQGAEFDLLINLDGLNEVVLPATENHPSGVHTEFPGDWGSTTVELTRPDYRHNVGLAIFLRRQQQSDAIQAGTFPWCYSPVSQLRWSYRHHQLEQEITESLRNAAAMTRQSASYCSSGPPEEFGSAQAMYDESIDLWCRSSILLHRECVINQIRYFHFLEPISDLPVSSPLGETGIARVESDARTAAIHGCWPLMRTRSRKQLDAAGVEFADLTDTFSNLDTAPPTESEPADQILVCKAIAGRIKKFLAQNPWKSAK